LEPLWPAEQLGRGDAAEKGDRLRLTPA